MSNIKKFLGQRIKEIRKARGITQEQLAERIGIGTPNISYIETGRYAPTIENFEKIAEELGVEPYELYRFDSVKPIIEMRKELYAELDKNDELLKLIYKIFKAVN